MDKATIKKELEKLAKKSTKVLVSINDPAIDTIKGDFVLGTLLRLIAVSLTD